MCLPKGIWLKNSYMRQVLPRDYGLKCQKCLKNLLLVNLVLMSQVQTTKNSSFPESINLRGLWHELQADTVTVDTGSQSQAKSSK